MVTRSSLKVLVAVLFACVFVALSAREAKAAPAPAWCGEGTEAMASDVCYIDGRANAAGHKTLVIWLHGVIVKDTAMSHAHEKMLSRIAKATGIEMLFPKGVPGEQLVAWPGTADAQAKQEQALIDQWMAAKAALEKRENKSYDETFIFGFSSGAYFASSLALRGRADVDGYAVFAGGQSGVKGTDANAHFAPVYVGVCTNDPTGTAKHARGFAGSLAAAGIPRMVNEQAVGHDISPTHFLGALAYLRSKKQVARV